MFIWINVGLARTVHPPQGTHTICLCNGCNFMANVLYLQFASSVVVYISLNVYIYQSLTNVVTNIVTLPSVNCRPFASEVVV